jgi:hypothetical protein
MDNLPDVQKELEMERDKLNRMINEARKARLPNNEAIIEQSRKVDNLIGQVQKVAKHVKTSDSDHSL